jgi:hypothetical protein
MSRVPVVLRLYLLLELYRAAASCSLVEIDNYLHYCSLYL